MSAQALPVLLAHLRGQQNNELTVSRRARTAEKLSRQASPDLLLQHAVEDENEHALQGVEDGEEVGHDHRALVDVHQAEGPGQAEQTQESDGADHPGPAGKQS